MYSKFSKVLPSLALAIFLLQFFSCSESNTIQNLPNDSIQIPEGEILGSSFMTENIQSILSPDTVLQILKERNIDFIEDRLTIRNTSERIRKASLGQFPAAVILSCLDSRVPVEDVFHSGIGDLFIARVAGNISNEDILGSLEYGCKVSGAKLIVVLGHEHCGAVKSAIDDVKLGNITAVLSKIRPAIDRATGYEGEKSASNHSFLEAVTKANVLNTIDAIRANSPILLEMESQGLIKIVGAEYHMETGQVEFLN